MHNPVAFENQFRRPARSISAAPLFATYLRDRLRGGRPVTVAHDAGSMRRADDLRDALETVDVPVDASAFLLKHRVDSVVADGEVVGEVSDAVAVIVDDEISTGETMARAVRACRRAGARRVVAAATHAVFVGEPSLGDIDEFVVTDTVPRVAHRHQLTVLGCAQLLADAIKEWCEPEKE